MNDEHIGYTQKAVQDEGKNDLSPASSPLPRLGRKFGFKGSYIARRR